MTVQWLGLGVLVIGVVAIAVLSGQTPPTSIGLGRFRRAAPPPPLVTDDFAGAEGPPAEGGFGRFRRLHDSRPPPLA